MMKFSLKLSVSLCATKRPRVSAVPPGAKGTTMRTVLAGQLCARAVGPVKAKFTGKLLLSDLKPPNSYSLSFEGSGGAAGFGKGGAQVSLKAEGAATRLTYSAKASVGGKLAQVGSRLIDGVARKMADDFFTAFNEKLAGPAAKAAGAEAPATGKRRIHPAWWVAGALLLVFLVYLALQPAH